MENEIDEIDKIPEAKAAFSDAETKLFNSYVEELIRYHKKMNDMAGRVRLNDQLEAIIEGLRTGRSSIFYLKSQEEHKRIKLFDADIARAVRERTGLNKTELANQLGIPLPCLCRYEKGISFPSNPPRSETARKYLAWLKEHDYNPRNL